MARKLVCIHGHFYQPPRENPWLEAVEVEDSAAPYHDWNVRVNAECYAANAGARLLGADGRVAQIVNNYESISFDFGPTLLAWMEAADPRTYAAILEADRRSVEARGGHGNAIAHAYNHVILPLASQRDRVTQVRWGIADFVHRFGRKPEGMWLPETAVDLPTLEVLAAHDVAFTVLAPHQALAVRTLGGGEDDWTTLEGDSIDPKRPYRVVLPSGRTIAAFFYDGPVSRAIAFEGLLGDGGAFARRLEGAFAAGGKRDQLVHVATDGESYGHHHRFGDMALAFALDALVREHGLALTNYGEMLGECPPTEEVRIAERTSWSCAHGVGRWSKDCGCRFSTGTSQTWRAPLRAALDWLRDELDRLFEEKGRKLLRDPWEARDRYIEVVLGRIEERIDAFLAEHAVRRLDHFERVEVLSLLEMERHRMLMFTSCGWFFDDPAGLESVQILKYAARALQLGGGLGGGKLEARLVERLALLRSNDPARGTGADIYHDLVKPSIVGLRRVVAHHAITSLFEPPEAEQQLYCYKVNTLDWCEERYGASRLAVGRVRTRSLVTLETEDLSFGVLHFGGHDFNCSMRGAVGFERYAAMRDELLQTFESKSLTDVVHALDRNFEGRYFALPDIFLEGRRTVLGTVTSGVVQELQGVYERFYDEHRKLFDFLRDARFPLPDAVVRTIELTLQRRFVDALERVGRPEVSGDKALDAVEDLVEEILRRGVALEDRVLEPPLTGAADRLAATLVRGWAGPDAVAFRRLLAATTRLGAPPQFWSAQRTVLTALRQSPPPDGGENVAALDDLLAELGIYAPPRQA